MPTHAVDAPGRPGKHPLLVLGGSAGSHDALAAVLAGIDQPDRYRVAVVVHQTADGLVRLPHYLSQRCGFEVAYATDAEHLQPGRALLAPPERHLLIEGDRVLLTDGPHENNWRPSVDVLFRSAALSAGPQVVAVQLSGWLDDGAAGCVAVQSCGGRVVVQDPLESVADGMPRAAIAAVDSPALIAPAGAIGPALDDLPAATHSGPSPATRRHLALEVALAHGKSGLRTSELLGDPAGLGCPSCGGPLSHAADAANERAPRFRCHIGHAFSKRLLEHLQQQEALQALNVARRQLLERQRLLETQAERGPGRRHLITARLDECRQAVERLEELLALLAAATAAPLPHEPSPAVDEPTPAAAVERETVFTPADKS